MRALSEGGDPVPRRVQSTATGRQADATGITNGSTRPLAVARAAVAPADWPDDPASCSYELMGLVALADPLRADIPQAVRDCLDAGIRIVVITGDHPDTGRW